MAGKLTPLEFAEPYYILKVFLYPQELDGNGPKSGYVSPKGTQTVRLDHYRLGHSHYRNIFEATHAGQHGLRHRDYRILSVKAGVGGRKKATVFYVDRGLPPTTPGSSMSTSPV